MLIERSRSCAVAELEAGIWSPNGPEYAANLVSLRLPPVKLLHFAMDTDFDLESLTNIEDKFVQNFSSRKNRPMSLKPIIPVSISPVIKMDTIMVACMD
jgi:hypothetical protein